MSMIHAILGVRASNSPGGRADSQDRMDQLTDVRPKKLRNTFEEAVAADIVFASEAAAA